MLDDDQVSATPAEPVIPLYVGTREVSSYADLEELFKDPNFHPVTHGPGRRSRPFIGETILAFDGEEHFKTRKAQAQLFSRRTLEHYELDVVVPAIERRLAAAAAHRDEDGLVRVDLLRLGREMLSAMAAKIIGFEPLDDGNRLDRFMSLMGYLLGGLSVEFAIADHERILQDGFAAKEDFWREFVLPAKEAVLSPEGAGRRSARQDLMSVLLNDNPELDDDSLIRNCILYAAASINTTAAAAVHTVDNLTRWFAEHPDDWERRNDRSFLRRAASETLRLHPPAPGMLREAGAEKTTQSGIHLEQGDICKMHVTRANLETERFGECPAHFVPEREAKDAKPYGLAFGGGRHTCIGRPLALPSHASPDEMIDGILVKLLRAFYQAGVEPDPERAPELQASARETFDTYPVVFRTL
jgi:cytochrome P450